MSAVAFGITDKHADSFHFIAIALACIWSVVDASPPVTKRHALSAATRSPEHSAFRRQ